MTQPRSSALSEVRRAQLEALAQEIAHAIGIHDDTIFEVDDCMGFNVSLAKQIALDALLRAEASPPAALPAETPRAETWQPRETAPKDRKVLVWKAESESAVVARLKNGRWVAAWDHQPIEGNDYFDVTHWQPLPAPPQASRAVEGDE